MNYVGKFFSNFKGFYNDINSATLTGAIDILVVRQEDGTYITSPWHVRFGKMGVIRAREKLVDIEINGEPVKLCMKLGEAGEAFFVQEADSNLQAPLHMPSDASAEYLEGGYHRTLDSDAGVGRDDTQNLIHQHTDTDTEFSEDLYDKLCDTVITIDGDDITVTEVPKPVIRTESVTMDNNHYFTSHGSYIRLSQGHKFITATIATQTHMSGDDVEAKKSKSRNVSGESSSQSPLADGALVPLTLRAELSAEVTESKVLASKNLVMHHSEGDVTITQRVQGYEQLSGANLNAVVNEDSDVSRDRLGNHMDLHEAPFPLSSSSVGQNSLSLNAHTSSNSRQEEIFEMELSDDEAVDRQRARDAKGAKDLVEGELCDELEPEWTRNPFAYSFHPFSDTDITPATSPIGSRPPSPKSDTEYETKKYDATSQTQLTGDELMLLDDIKWEWGEFPQLTPIPSKKPSTASENALTKEEKPSGGLFQFMRKTKKLRHQPLEEGIYLDDLNLSSMDPEVAALYLYGAKSGGHLSARQSKDEDNESGQGMSLPQSPVTFDQESSSSAPLVATGCGLVGGAVNLSDVAMSLCGGLQDAERGVAVEQFRKHLITHDSFCENPNLLTDPNLVVRLNNRFYSWSVAGPIIMSQLVFNKSLAEQSIETLIRQHMPKKERRRGLWWWSRGNQSTTASSSASAPNPQAIINTASANDVAVKVKSKPRKLRGREGSTSGEESDTASSIPTETTGSTRTHAREKFIKSLKLTSEQIASLNLKDGANEVTFSVTTQYQGTSRCTCYIYLWSWDDRIIVSDIDGTITRSDVWGQVLPMIGKDWSQAGIANLYQMINRNGYKFLYLSARAIGQSKITRDYLHSVRQGNLCLPDGPLLLSPSSLLSAFYKEVIERKPEEFKIGCLRDIGALFPSSRTPFYAGFGNKINDTFAYRAVGILISRIFTVNPKGELSMGLSFQSSYTKLSDIVDHFFPPLLHCHCHHEVVEAGKFPGAIEYSDFTYWREPLPDIQEDLASIVSTKPERNMSRKDSSREKLRQSKRWRRK